MSVDIINFVTASLVTTAQILKNLHVHEICVEYECDISACEKRHPRTCMYYRDYGRCKFIEYCIYKHSQPVNETFTKQIETRTREFEKILEKKVKEISTMGEQLENSIMKLEDIEKLLENQNKYMKEIFKKVENKEQKRIEAIDTIIEKSNTTTNNLEEDVLGSKQRVI